MIEGIVGLPPDPDSDSDSDTDGACVDERILNISRGAWLEFKELDGKCGRGHPSHSAPCLGPELKDCSEEASVEAVASPRPLKRKREDREEDQLEAIYYRDPVPGYGTEVR